MRQRFATWPARLRQHDWQRWRRAASGTHGLGLVEQALCLTLRAPSPNPVSARLFRPAEMKAPAYSVQPKAVAAPPCGAGSEHTAWRLILCCGGGRCPREADRALVLPAELAAPLYLHVHVLRLSSDHQSQNGWSHGELHLAATRSGFATALQLPYVIHSIRRVFREFEDLETATRCRRETTSVCRTLTRYASKNALIAAQDSAACSAQANTTSIDLDALRNSHTLQAQASTMT